MEIKLIRESFGDTFTEGKLFIDNVFECYTVEDTDRKMEEDLTRKINGKTAIPRGRYEVILSMSNRFKKVLPEVLNVPGFTGIRIHAGNSSIDTEGCIILGSVNAKVDDDWVGGSKIALTQFMTKLETAKSNNEQMFIEIS